MNGLLTMSYVAPLMPHLTPNPPTSGVVVDPLDPQHALRSPPFGRFSHPALPPDAASPPPSAAVVARLLRLSYDTSQSASDSGGVAAMEQSCIDYSPHKPTDS